MDDVVSPNSNDNVLHTAHTQVIDGVVVKETMMIDDSTPGVISGSFTVNYGKKTFDRSGVTNISIDFDT